MLVAVPEFHDCVSPTFDFCHKLTLWRLDEKGFKRVGERRCSTLGPSERPARLHAMGVEVLLCGAIGVSVERDIRARGLDVISGVTGKVVEVVAAYASRTLDHPKFQMPGAAADAHGPVCDREVKP
jgi:predicted Fe-Mo cluster-binding NifX family protein